MNIKTVTLDGSEVKVEGLGGQNTIVQNLGGSAVYASASPGVEAGADGVAEISAGGGINLYGTNGTVYLLGSGKVQLVGTDYSTVNFKLPSSASGGGGGHLCSFDIFVRGMVSDDGLCFLEEERV